MSFRKYSAEFFTKPLRSAVVVKRADDDIGLSCRLFPMTTSVRNRFLAFTFTDVSLVPFFRPVVLREDDDFAIEREPE